MSARKGLTNPPNPSIMEVDGRSGLKPQFIGHRAGTLSKSTNRWYISIFGHRHGAHQWAWLYMTGVWPSTSVDHIDRDPTNNRWGNLRLASPVEQNCNRPWKDGKTVKEGGMRGTQMKRHKPHHAPTWTAIIQHGHRRYYLGAYRTTEEAHEAYVAAGRLIKGEFFSQENATVLVNPATAQRIKQMVEAADERYHAASGQAEH